MIEINATIECVSDLLDAVNEAAYEMINQMNRVNPEQLGLDYRAGYTLFIDDDYIAVNINNDRTLQYYGGFEYIDQEYRTVIGDHVFYSREHDRVDGALKFFERIEA